MAGPRFLATRPKLGWLPLPVVRYSGAGLISGIEAHDRAGNGEIWRLATELRMVNVMRP